MIVCVLFTAVLAQPVRADYQYTFALDSDTARICNSPDCPTYNYPADSFSFITPNILGTVGQTAAIPSSENLNGFWFPTIQVDYIYSVGPVVFISLPYDFSKPVGEVGGLYFIAENSPFGVGTYPASAGRGISLGDGNTLMVSYTTGSLTISSVPEPTTMLLLGSGLLGLLGLRRKSKK